jgi:hypothetical protein
MVVVAFWLAQSVVVVGELDGPWEGGENRTWEEDNTMVVAVVGAIAVVKNYGCCCSFGY